MYKSKLQELCQQEKMALPKYTCIKDGDDHPPRFRASVAIGVAAFHTPSAANSSKQALNEAARLAFLHFTSDENSEKVKKGVESSKSSQYKELTYKAKLQELCQKKKWALPKYTCLRDGEDHCPQFKASIVVRGLAFDTLSPCTSLKLALNQVAQLAFLHFTSQASDKKSENDDKKNLGKEVESSNFKQDKSVNQCSVLVASYAVADVHGGFKNKLRMYTQKNNLHQPAYCTEKVGHCFNSIVRVGEESSTSNELFTTAEEAENSAAATALLALLTDAFHEKNDPSSYKILLNKLANEEGFFPPIYKTTRSDESDSQAFSTMVEIEGEVFRGAAAESEKLAELNSARAAYTALIERKLFEPRDEITKLGRHLGSCGISDPREDSTNLVADTEHGTLVQGAIVENQESGDDRMTRAIVPEMKGYLLSNRVRVFTCFPNMALPKGTVVLPISEDKWAVVALDFPTEIFHEV